MRISLSPTPSIVINLISQQRETWQQTERLSSTAQPHRIPPKYQWFTLTSYKSEALTEPLRSGFIKDLAQCVVDSVFTIHHNVDSCDQTSRPSWIQKPEAVEQKKKAPRNNIQKPYQLNDKLYFTSPSYYTRKTSCYSQAVRFPQSPQPQTIYRCSVSMFPLCWHSYVGGAFSKH